MLQKADFLSLVSIQGSGCIYPASFQICKDRSGCIMRNGNKIRCKIFGIHATGFRDLKEACRWIGLQQLELQVVCGVNVATPVRVGDYVWFSELDLVDLLAAQQDAA